MTKRVATILCLAVLAVSLGGCGKCGGWPWDRGSSACKADLSR
jgi:hypothetical protein